MKNIKITFYKALSLILIIVSTGVSTIYAQSILIGSIQFEKNTPLNQISICQFGKKVSSQIHTVGTSKISYEISKSNAQTRFYILITPTAPEHELKKFPEQDGQQHTIDYLKIGTDTPYAFYVLDLVQDPVAPTTDLINAPAQPTFHWEIREDTLPETGQIPDTAIIINYFPSLVKTVKGGTSLELPTIFMNTPLAEQFESKENFEDALIKLQLSSLEFNAIHAPIKRKTKIDGPRLLIMDTLT
jgi:hypothetical protein